MLLPTGVRYRQGPTRHSYAHAQYTQCVCSPYAACVCVYIAIGQCKTMHGVMPASSACVLIPPRVLLFIGSVVRWFTFHWFT